MKVVFVSNYFNHHQKQLCDELSRLSSFVFIETDYKNIQGFQSRLQEKYLVQLNENDENSRAQCLRIILDADVCIFGSCSNIFIQQRMKENKLSFLYTERFFKKGLWRRYIPIVYKKIYQRRIWTRRWPSSARVFTIWNTKCI